MMKRWLSMGSKLGLLLVMTTGLLACERKEFGNCQACWDGVCGPYSGYDSIGLSWDSAKRELCDKLDKEKELGICYKRNTNEIEYKCKDKKYKWSLRLPVISPK